MWRPDGWDNPYHEETWQGQEKDIFEAGADAILESLRAKGIKTNKFRTNSNPIYLTNPRQNGVYVFIPEEKTLGKVLMKMANIPERIKETNKEGNHGR